MLLTFLILTGITQMTLNTDAEIYNEVTFDMVSENDIILITFNNQTGNPAMDTRIEIDSHSGNGNGLVENTEVESYTNYLTDQVKGLTLTQNTYLDRKALKIKSTTVQVRNAEGATNSTKPLQVIYISELETLEDPGVLQWHTVVFLGEYYGNNTITVIAPPGWRIAKNPKNLQQIHLTEDGGEITGIAAETYDVEVKMYDPSKLGDGGQSSDTSNLTQNEIILIAIPLAVIVFLIIFFISRRKRSRSGKQKNGSLENMNHHIDEKKNKESSN